MFGVHDKRFVSIHLCVIISRLRFHSKLFFFHVIPMLKRANLFPFAFRDRRCSNCELKDKVILSELKVKRVRIVESRSLQSLGILGKQIKFTSAFCTFARVS